MCWGDVQLLQTTNGEEWRRVIGETRLELAKIPRFWIKKTENVFGSWR